MIRVRFARPSDAPQIKEAFQSQGLEVDLPLDASVVQADSELLDYATMLVLVGESENGKIEFTVIVRLSSELYLIADPETPKLGKKMLAAVPEIERTIKAASQQMLDAGFAAPNDIQAWVPRDMTGMVNFLKKRLKFVVEPGEFVPLFRRL